MCYLRRGHDIRKSSNDKNYGYQTNKYMFYMVHKGNSWFKMLIVTLPIFVLHHKISSTVIFWSFLYLAVCTIFSEMCSAKLVMHPFYYLDISSVM